MVRGSLLAVFFAALLLAVAGVASAANGSPGLGDPFFPNAGNGGYDVQHYEVRLRYQPRKHRLGGTAYIGAVATQALDRFDLDFVGFRISALKVNGVDAVRARSGQELVITPATQIPNGAHFTVRITYAGIPHAIVDPDGSLDGWVRTKDGAFVAGEPQGSPSWYPCNNYPTDKATYDIRLTVPRGLTAISNGSLARKIRLRYTTIFQWHERFPMATYLSTATIGRFIVHRTRTASGIPVYLASDTGFGKAGVTSLRRTPQIIEYYRKTFGPYPFESAGGIADDAPNVGYSLETQTKPVYAYVPDESTVAHELSHQWFGDSATLSTWPDIWLHEGFATFAEWLWDAHAGGSTVHHRFQSAYSTPAGNTQFWNPPPADPGQAKNLFAFSVYVRGGMTLQALREKIGNDDVFFGILRDWLDQHRYGNDTTAQFQALAEAESGLDLDHFFDVWLRTPGKPTGW
ncbi:MAG TPA: M1 family metallopeptidase [Gaiellaceae bacterium]